MRQNCKEKCHISLLSVRRLSPCSRRLSVRCKVHDVQPIRSKLHVCRLRGWQQLAKGKDCVVLVPQEVGPVIAQYKVITCLCRVIWRQQISALSITKLGRGLGRKLQVEASASYQQKPPKLEPRYGLPSPSKAWCYHGRDLWMSTFIGAFKLWGTQFLVLKSTKDVSRPKKYIVVQLSVTFIG